MLIALAVWGWYLVSAYLVVLAVDAAWAALQLARPQLNPAWADANLTEAQVTQSLAALCSSGVMHIEIMLPHSIPTASDQSTPYAGSFVGHSSNCYVASGKERWAAAAAAAGAHAAAAAAGTAALRHCDASGELVRAPVQSSQPAAWALRLKSA